MAWSSITGAPIHAQLHLLLAELNDFCVGWNQSAAQDLRLLDAGGNPGLKGQLQDWDLAGPMQYLDVGGNNLSGRAKQPRHTYLVLQHRLQIMVMSAADTDPFCPAKLIQNFLLL